ncbi:hypothetical protein D3C87_1979900 [compost metagenome]
MTIERPKSPDRILPAQMTNCSGMLRSRPSTLRISAICCGSAMSPSISAAGSPGMRRMSVKTATETMTIVGIAITRRLSMNLIMGSPY